MLGFANSAGGTLIYGVAIFAERARKSLPERLASVKDPTPTVEWIQQMTKGQAPPRFSKVQIQQVECSGEADCVFVLEVSRDPIAHQAPDGLYCRRANLETLWTSDL